MFNGNKELGKRFLDIAGSFNKPKKKLKKKGYTLKQFEGGNLTYSQFNDLIENHMRIEKYFGSRLIRSQAWHRRKIALFSKIESKIAGLIKRFRNE